MLNQKVYLSSGAYFETYIMDSEINYREYRKRPAIIVAPGGAYAIHATKESEPVALQFMQMGYQTFVLKYSVGSDRFDIKRVEFRESTTGSSIECQINIGTLFSEI